mgnify:CR=1 FL=1
MKAPSFDYVRPGSVDEVLSLLRHHGDDARILAGGQALMATLNMRLSEPELLIDINAIESLSGIELKTDHLWIGAMIKSYELFPVGVVPHIGDFATLAEAHAWLEGAGYADYTA